MRQKSTGEIRENVSHVYLNLFFAIEVYVKKLQELKMCDMLFMVLRKK